MNAFLNPHNGTSLTGVIDLTARSISLFTLNNEQKEEPTYITDIFIPTSNISIAEPYDVQIDELGDSIIQIYQFTGTINDTRVAGLESLLNYINENFFSKDEPAVNEHHYHITRKQYNQDFTTHNLYKVDKRKTYNIKNHRYNDNHHYNKKQYITNNITNNISKQNNIVNSENILNIKKDYSTKQYITNNFKFHSDYLENNLYKKYDNRIFNNTNNIQKNINTYDNDISNSYKINKITNLKKSYYNCIDDVIFNNTKIYILMIISM